MLGQHVAAEQVFPAPITGTGVQLAKTSKGRGFWYYTPSFFWVLLLFIGMKLALWNFSATLHIYGDFEIYGMLVLGAAIVVALFADTKKVSQAKQDNVKEANLIADCAFWYGVICFVAVALWGFKSLMDLTTTDGAVAQLNGISIDGIELHLGTIVDTTIRVFTNFEFMLLTGINWYWRRLANTLNANTLQVQSQITTSS